MRIGDLMILTLRRPQQAAARLRALKLGWGARWALLLLAVTVSSLLAGLAQILFPPPPDWSLKPLFDAPLALAGMQLGAMLLSAGAVTLAGRAFGGSGTFADAILLIGWSELVLCAVQATELVLLLVLPPSGPLMSLIAFGLSIWLAVSMTRALHGFSSTAKVALGFFVVLFVIATLLSVLGGALGLFPEVAP